MAGGCCCEGLVGHLGAGRVMMQRVSVAAVVPASAFESWHCKPLQAQPQEEGVMGRGGGGGGGGGEAAAAAAAAAASSEQHSLRAALTEKANGSCPYWNRTEYRLVGCWWIGP